MAIKTIIRQLISKWGIMSIEMQKAYEADQAVIREDGTPDYVDVEETTPEPPVQQPAQPEVIPQADDIPGQQAITGALYQ